MELITWIKDHTAEIWTVTASVITVASVITKLTPSTKDDAFLARVIAFLALNKPGAPPPPDGA